MRQHAVTVLASWPSRPEGSPPEPVYVEETLPQDLVDDLLRRGWTVVDVRLLSGGDAPRCKLRGVTAGTIPPLSAGELRALELDLKVHKQLRQDDAPPGDKDSRALKDKDDIDALLSFGKVDGAQHVPALQAAQAEVPRVDLPKPRGRPKGAKDLKPRKPTGVLKGAARASKLRKEAERGIVDSLVPEIVPLPKEEK